MILHQKSSDIFRSGTNLRREIDLGGSVGQDGSGFFYYQNYKVEALNMTKIQILVQVFFFIKFTKLNLKHDINSNFLQNIFINWY